MFRKEAVKATPFHGKLTAVPHTDFTLAELLSSARTIGLAADVEGRDEKLGWPIDSL